MFADAIGDGEAPHLTLGSGARRHCKTESSGTEVMEDGVPNPVNVL